MPAGPAGASLGNGECEFRGFSWLKEPPQPIPGLKVQIYKQMGRERHWRGTELTQQRLSSDTLGWSFPERRSICFLPTAKHGLEENMRFSQKGKEAHLGEPKGDP